MSESPEKAQLVQMVNEHLKAGGPPEAERALQSVILQNPENAKAMDLLGAVCQMQGKLDPAIQWIKRAIAIAPDDWGSHYNLGVLLTMVGQKNEAIAAYNRALQLNPRATSAHNNLGNLFQSQGRLTEAKHHFEEALRLQPDYVLAHNNVAMLLLALGKIDEAIVRLRHTLALRPDYVQAHSNLLLALNSHEGYDAAALLREHIQFAKQHAAHISSMSLSPRTRRANDRLRIGYISADFRSHSVAFFLDRILEHHDRARFQITCYSNVTHPDAMTQRMRTHSEQWREIWNLSDDEAAQLIARDEIDILVDLGGHTERSRLLVLARKPAPIQVSYLGYPNTTGLPQVDYLITDSHIAPPGTESNYTEKLIRLAGSFFCYFGPDLGVPVAPPLVLTNGYVTFGVLTNWVKARPAMMELWAQILQRVEKSRLILKANSLRDDHLAKEVKTFFTAQGISPDRIDVQGWTDFLPYLQLMSQIDIGLDTFPFNGHTTTCHQLWMGVPVITLVGQTHGSRMGLSVFSALGLDELAANSPEQYVDIAIRLARDPEKLKTLRAETRSRWQKSGLLDGPRFTRKLEFAYEHISQQSGSAA